MSISRVFVTGLTLILAAVVAGPLADAAAQPKTEKFRGWEVRCDGKDDCIAVSVTEGAQFIVATKTKGDEAPTLMVHVPPQAQKDDPVVIHPESGPTFQTRIWDCTEKFCEARIASEANPTVLGKMIADTKGYIVYRLGENLHVVTFSLVDFRKALEAMKQ